MHQTGLWSAPDPEALIAPFPTLHLLWTKRSEE